MFHPLITPLTTYMYTTDIQENGTVSATDEERLPPGGFSLRHGFPEWFGRGKRRVSDRRESRSSQRAVAVDNQGTPRNVPLIMKPLPDTPESAGKLSDAGPAGGRDVSIYDVLKYIRSTFDSEETMDSIPLDAAGNPGAWHAWRSHQRKQGKLRDGEPAADAEVASQEEEGQGGAPGADRSSQNTGGRRPGEWNWEGVWEDRVKKNIAMSLSEPVLYGGAATAPHDELVSLSWSLESLDFCLMVAN